MGTGYFPGGEVWLGHAADHSPPSSAAVMEDRAIPHPSSGPSCACNGITHFCIIFSTSSATAIQYIDPQSPNMNLW